MSSENNRSSNRLINETSPYLLGHAHNPVDWYPWCSEAFEKAKKEDKPIFLSIGYSTCHWCHVMEEESFENKIIADILNSKFVSIKVDREERPDIDEVYMSALQSMSGSGGWPMSIFLTAEGKPFYAGTYFPPQDGFNIIGFERVLLAIAHGWANRREELLTSAEGIIDAISMTVKKSQPPPPLEPSLADEAFSQLASIYDHKYGGFGSSPKFPTPCILSFLFRYWRLKPKSKALEMAEHTLDKMACGGIYDHIGGGFHRYATDSRWLIPHFEKMLYDQALISRCYIQGWQITKNPEYSKVICETFDYVLRDMRDKKGGFYSAEDADSEGKEGSFYLWTKHEIEQILGDEDADIFNEFYGITDDGNFEYKNILNIQMSASELGKRCDYDERTINEIISHCRRKILETRSKRIRPLRDEKIISGWNGLMIESLAFGGAALGRRDYIEAAQNAADFIFGSLFQDGRLMRYYKDGKMVGKAYLEDYAALTAAMTALYGATFEVKWLERAINLADKMIELFEDKQNGGFFMIGRDGEELVISPKPSHDGATVCGNSAAVESLLRLHLLTSNPTYKEKAAAIMNFFANQLKEHPTSLTGMLACFDILFGPTEEIVIVGGNNKKQASEMIRLLESSFLPCAAVISLKDGLIEELSPFAKSKRAVYNKTTAYICHNKTCLEPITEWTEFEKAIETLCPTKTVLKGIFLCR